MVVIKGAINWKSETPLTYDIVAQKTHAPFVEWGTKGRAVIPAELQAIAAEYRNKGKGTGVKAKIAIYAWCKREGIPEDRWFLVYRSIMTNGIRPTPFFFSSFFEVKDQLVQNVKDILHD